MTTMDTNLRGRLRNTSLPKSNGLFPLFEAVVNSIHSIEDAKRTGSGRIKVNVLRGDQLPFNLEGTKPSGGTESSIF